MTLPLAIPGLDVLAEMGRDRFARRFRLGGRGARHLVLLEGLDANTASAVLGVARKFEARSIAGVAPLLEIVQHGDGHGFVIGVEPGDSLWRTFGIGELAALPLLRKVAEAVARLHAHGLAHGALMGEAALARDGADGAVVLPPVVAPESMPEVARTMGKNPTEPDDFAALSSVARDLAAIAQLACQLISGARAERSSGVGVVPESVQLLASPATGQAVRLLFELASKDPSVDASRELLVRIGWAKDPERVQAAAVARPVVVRAPRAEPAASGAQDETAADAGPPKRRVREAPKKTRIPLIVGPLVLAAVGGLLYVMGGDDALREMSAGAGTKPPQDAPVVAALPKAAPPPAPVDTTPDPDAAAAADRIIQDMKAKKENKPAPAKPSYDRTLIDAGDKLKAEGQVILLDLKEKKIPFEQSNTKLAEAIQKLEAARDEYVKFVEQYPSRERLVEKSIEDINSLLYFAYRNRKSLGSTK